MGYSHLYSAISMPTFQKNKNSHISVFYIKKIDNLFSSAENSALYIANFENFDII